MFKEYILDNWSLILIMVAFVILLKTTFFMEKKTINRMLALVAAVFAFSQVVFVEFYLNELDEFRDLRTVLIAVRYSATPLVMAMILYTLVHKERVFVFAPALAFAAVNFVSIFNGIVFSIGDDNSLVRGPLGYLPYFAVGLYGIFLVYSFFKYSNKQMSEIIPILFMAFAFGSGLVLPFILGKDYSKIFCPTIMIALFVYYVFSILQLTSKDALTGLLNRQSYYVTVNDNPKTITGIVSVDMNGLKHINDTDGHTAGDEALKTISHCLMRAKKGKQSAFRMGGDEFLLVCRRSSEKEIEQLIDHIRKIVSETKYSCAIGYSFSSDGSMSIEEMLKASDEMMYEDKAAYYKRVGESKYRG
ncbi:MAG: GGDEF domain-containing protein [Lachnospiraceae bacterium]|nr:GGDEF domain-containing protein [Lachnospiraceae bacterium]